MSATLVAMLALFSIPLAAHEVVDASAPERLAVTIYRDPSQYDFDPNRPKGFGLVSETRTVTLPPGESTIRFTGVAEGMIAVSAMVSGLPGGVIEKNRNAALLSPAALIDGTLGNRVTITRTNPATGAELSEQAVVRTRADGGLVLQTAQGYEAVRCSGLPERLGFDRVPAGLSAEPVFTIDARDETGGTYTVTLTYLAWGFDWRAHYVATLHDGKAGGRRDMRMRSWLTLVNDNAQSFENAELSVVAGTLNIESDFEDLAEPPRGAPLRLECWPIGNTAEGTYPGQIDVPETLMLSAPTAEIVLSGSRLRAQEFDSASPVAMIASEENLGDFKLFRVPEPVTVRAKGMKQVAFLDKDRVRGELIKEAYCDVYGRFDEDQDSRPVSLLYRVENEEKLGLGASLPRGGATVFEPSSAGELLIGESGLRDYAVGEEVEIRLGRSSHVFGQCAGTGSSQDMGPDENDWQEVRAVLTNAGRNSIEVELQIGSSAGWQVKKARGARVRNGTHVVTVRVAAGGTSEMRFWVRDLD
ncbi:DUF4139 domain-containing protein [Altererythrobacter sp. Z27]|uniref:DUF4139 domain-containing protein n=1 Tax=Altererythrobacter sp. Z27 TaxID=3461147 RepID=UPI0040449EFE